MKRIKHLIKYTVLVGASMGLSACATMSEEECQTADWRVVGFDDAARGYEDKRIREHAEACASAKVRVDFTAYQAGYEQGLQRFCTASNGFNVGESAKAHPQQCHSANYSKFVAGYMLGVEARALNQERSSLNKQIDEQEKQVASLQTAIDQADEILTQPNSTREDKRSAQERKKSLSSLLLRIKSELQDLDLQTRQLLEQRNHLASKAR